MGISPTSSMVCIGSHSHRAPARVPRRRHARCSSSRLGELAASPGRAWAGWPTGCSPTSCPDRCRDRTGERRRVVVGVDSSAGSAGVLRWPQPRRTCVALRSRVLHAWHPSPLFSWGCCRTHQCSTGYGPSPGRSPAGRPEAASGVADVVTTSVEGSQAQQLLEASETASVVVVGRRALGSVAGAVLGSASRQVVHHLSCPVAVIPTGE